jgi:hypothetical protein
MYSFIFHCVHLLDNVTKWSNLLATVCPAIISTTLGAGVPPTTLHDTVIFRPSVSNNRFSDVTFSMLKLDGSTVKQYRPTQQ